MDSATLLLQEVKASLIYLVPTGEKPYTYNYDPPPAGKPKRFGTFAEQKMAIRDGRAIAGELSLDRQGFVLRREPTQVVDFYDDAEVEAVYYPEIERLVAAQTGANRVVIFDHTVRSAQPVKRSDMLVREPVPRVHNDYTDKSGPQRVRDLVPDEAEELLKHRYAIVNIWRPIRGPVEQLPLALCDAESLGPDDLVASDLIYRDRVGETYAVAHNPRHRWYYFPRMQRDEVVLIKTFDSDRNRARFVAHTAFDDPTTRPDAPPRESIEVRTLLFFPDT